MVGVLLCKGHREASLFRVFYFGSMDSGDGLSGGAGGCFCRLWRDAAAAAAAPKASANAQPKAHSATSAEASE